MEGGRGAGVARRHDANRGAGRTAVRHRLRRADGASCVGEAGWHDERGVGAACGASTLGAGFRCGGTRLLEHGGESHSSFRWHSECRVGRRWRWAEYSHRAHAGTGWKSLRGEFARAGHGLENGCTECGRSIARDWRARDEGAHQYRVHHLASRAGVCDGTACGCRCGVGGEGGVL